VSGLLVAPGRVDELTDRLARLAGDAELRARLGRAGREVVQRDYELARLAEELRKAFAAAASPAVSANR
jgi:glycosyltransferase involved in cell wall biosynthesis